MGLNQRTHLDDVEARLIKTLDHSHDEIRAMLTHLVSAGGKRIRPRVALAVAATCGGGVVRDDAVSAAAAIEILHLASLYHDDVVDHAATRRGVQSVHTKWSVGHAVVAGDFLIARAVELAARLGPGADITFATAFADLCEGQLLELSSQFDPSRTESSYFASIAGKSAALFRCAGALGALSAGASVDVQDQMASFGHNLGMAFQVIDDLLDLTRTGEEIGKPAGNDVVQGVYTLPVIIALRADVAARELLRQEISAAEVETIVGLAHTSGGIGLARDVARRHLEAARDCLSAIPDPDPVALETLTDVLDELAGLDAIVAR